jgi:hypothetical protein
MKINLRAQGLWEAVCGEGEPSEREDMAALAALLRAVPAEMVPVLANKDSSNEAWEAIKLMRMGVSRAREATAQRLRKEFEAIAFKEGETLDGFGMRITTLANNLRSLGDTVEEVKIVQKFLREVPPQYAQIACSIETLLDLNGMSVEDACDRPRNGALSASLKTPMDNYCSRRSSGTRGRRIVDKAPAATPRLARARRRARLAGRTHATAAAAAAARATCRR